MNLTIEAEALDAARDGVIVVDGDRSTTTPYPPVGTDIDWVRVAPAEFVKLTEPCETCGGLGSSSSVHEALCGGTACPLCRGSGRPWLTINVEAHPMLASYWRRLFKEGCITDSFRAHVLDVVPIVGHEAWRRSTPEMPVITKVGSRFMLRRANGTCDWITLPPGDHVGRYAVLIEPEES